MAQALALSADDQVAVEPRLWPCWKAVRWTAGKVRRVRSV